MNKEKREERISIIRILGKHIERYSNVIITFMSIMTAACLGLIIYWFIEPDSNNLKIDNAYLVIYFFNLAFSLGTIGILIANKKGKIKEFSLSLWLHLYVFFLFGWATSISVLDMRDSLSPLVFLTITMIVGGILVVDPFYFIVLVGISTIIIFGFDGVKDYDYFKSSGEIINFFGFIGFSIVLSFRHFNVTVREFKSKDRLTQLTYFDDLTGLLNERSYMLEVDKLTKDIEDGKDVKFGLVVMDVNNLKITNDTYGHRYGCHLIIKSGEVLPTVFKTSKVYHVGGDEFIAILYGDDLENYKEVIEKFDNTLSYSHITFESTELVFSIARGYAIFGETKDYKSTFQKADKAMYENKQFIKAKYNLKSRD